MQTFVTTTSITLTVDAAFDKARSEQAVSMIIM
jgi:hypothetical protein